MRYALFFAALLLIGCAGPARMNAEQAEPVVTIEEHPLGISLAIQAARGICSARFSE